LIKKLLILVLLAGFSITALAEEPVQHLTIGGAVRLGSFDLSKGAKNALKPSVYYEQEKLENALGKFLFFNYSYQAFDIGMRWMRYSMEGSNDTLDQILDLDYLLITASYAFLEGDFLHPDLDSRLGLTVGTGQNLYKLTTKSSSALASQSVDQSISSTGPTYLGELFFEAVTRSGWGYRLGYFGIDTSHSKKSNGFTPSGSSSVNVYMTILWRY